MKFTHNNPAEYITYNINKKNYMLRYNNNDYSSKNLNKLIIKLKENYHNKEEKFQKIVVKNKIEYKYKKIIIYMSHNKVYFDINHIINLFDNTNVKDKYQEYKNNISLYDFRDNDHGGFYIKEFISQDIFYKMLLHSNNSFSNKFKEDIVKILDELTNNGNLMIINGDLKLVDNNLIIPNNKDKFDNINYCYTQTYDNYNLVNFIKSRIIEFKKNNWIRYCKRNVMYLFVSTLEDPTGLNRILCKIGFTGDLIERIKSLKNEYKSKFYLIGIKLVNREQDEIDFHLLLKNQFPELVVKIKIGNVEKNEIYVFDNYLYNTYLGYIESARFSLEELQLDEESKGIMNEYLYNIEERFETEILYKLQNSIKINDIVNEYQQNIAIKMYDTILHKIKYNHEESMKNYELKEIEINKNYELKVLELNTNKELKLKELETKINELTLTIELEKIKKSS